MPVYFHTLISAEALAGLDADRVRLFDCRFDLKDADAGAASFQAGHIPGAVHLHLDRDLAGRVTPGKTGRHPLPERDAFRQLLRSHGVDDAAQLVAYDDSGGLFAARLWWMARWAGHSAAAVLDGGYQAWLAWRDAGVTGGGEAQRRIEAAVEADVAEPAGAERAATLGAEQVGAMVTAPPPAPVTMQAVRENAASGAWHLLDARAADRFRGENETLDPIAGHIPGALNTPFQDNLAADGRFLDRASLRARFERLLGDRREGDVVCYCGSGISATHVVLAMMHAGLAEPPLYPGSWSEWITDPTNPVET